MKRVKTGPAHPVEAGMEPAHYQVHQAHRGDRLVQENIAILKRLMWSDGHTHLVLAGDPETTRHVHLALPKDLADKLLEIIPANETD